MSDTIVDPAAALARFRAAVLADPAAQAELAAIFVPEEFVAAAARVSASLGVAVDPAIIAAEITPDPLGLKRFEPCAMTSDGWPPRAWLPARAVATGDAPAFDWSWFGPQQLDQPFFEGNVRRAADLPFARMFRIRTSLAAIVAGAASEPTVPLSGLIFHMSRCGSTLAARMLAAIPDHVVLSEPGPVDAVFQWALTSGAPLADQVAALRAIVAALGRDRTGRTRRLFVKTDCWHALHLPLFRAAFPDVPWLFLHRDPGEVMVSQARMAGAHVVPGILPPELGGTATGSESMTDHAAWMLGRVCTAALDAWPSGGGLVVDYPDVRSAMLAAIPTHFGFAPDPAEVTAMAAAAERDAKAPDETFRPDSAAKQAEVTPEIAAAVARHLAAPRAALGALEEMAPPRAF